MSGDVSGDMSGHMSGDRPAPILPPATVGVLGGGQLGRYFVMAARTMGYRTIVLEPDPGAPAGAAADVHLAAAYDAPEALARLAAECAVITTEFENPPAAALHQLAEATLVRPRPGAIEITQDRRAEKRFLSGAGVPVAPFAVIDTAADLDTPLADRGVAFPAILKTARLGYDGKGQVTVHDDDELRVAWQQLGQVACVVEQRLPLDREVSVVLARGADGACASFPTVANTHVRGILDLTVVPAPAADDDHHAAADLAIAIAEALDYVGVLAVEMFVVDGRLVVNELAPRPHNSGHWTLDAAATSQFEQQVRAVCGLPLGDASLTSGGAAMVNLLGDDWAGGDPDWAAALASPGAHLHLYGKAEPRPGRKMGHLTVTADSAERAAALATAARAAARRASSTDGQ
ncbi:MAG: 5-(carboxyamino)imidazole ribonucleotide synthase [Acidimicrobiales bacterium]